MVLFHGKQIPTLKGVYELVGDKLGYEWKVIGRVYRMMQPTTMAAADLIRARAFRMTSKLVRTANNEQIIDILSRPNIGVLDPIKKGDGGGAGIFIGVDAGTCGAVSVSINQPPQQQQLQTPQPALPEALECNDYTLDEGDEDETTGGEAQPRQHIEMNGCVPVTDDPMDRHRPRSPGSSKKYERAMAEAKARLDAKRARQEAKRGLS